MATGHREVDRASSWPQDEPELVVEPAAEVAGGRVVLLEGRRRIAEREGRPAVHDPCPSLRRILDICDLTLDLEARATRSS